VLAVDARRSNDRWHVTTRSGTIATSRDAIEWCAEGASRGAGEILLTSWDRDGTRDGYDIDLLQRASREIDIPIIASGGANGASHMLDAFNAGADAVLAASIFHDGLATIAAIKSELANAGVEVRRC
jgi:imidazole glycerol phosphate synthase subunit HisF